MILVSQTPRLMQIYSGGVIAVFTVFALMYVNAYRRRVELDLDARQLLEARLGIIDNVGIAAIGRPVGGDCDVRRAAGPRRRSPARSIS